MAISAADIGWTDGHLRQIHLLSGRERACSVMRAIDLIGDAWAFLALRELFFANRRWDQIQAQTQAPRAILSDRLDRLVRNGLVTRARYQHRPERFEYRLTPMSLDLYPAIVLMMNWGDRWLQHGPLPRRLIHKSCGADLVAQLVCGACHGEVQAREVVQRAGPGIIVTAQVPGERLRRPSDNDVYARGRPCSVARTLSVVGNRWAVLTLREALSGARRFDEFRARTGLPTSTLTSRLRLFVGKGVLDAVPYQDRPVRYEYQLTEMGFDLYGVSLALLAWGDRWAATGDGPPLLLTHKVCGQRLEPRIVCGCCGEAFTAYDVERIEGDASGPRPA